MPFQSPLEAGNAFSWVLLKARRCHTEKKKKRTSRAEASGQGHNGSFTKFVTFSRRTVLL